MRTILERIWDKTSTLQLLTFFEKILFCSLCLLEPLYRAGFFIAQFYRKKMGGTVVPFSVLSVGNLSVGGTGKSVVVSFLGNLLVVGADRLRSCQLLEVWSRKTDNVVKTVILDDAYQNYKIFKNVEILLLDARKPFDNEHALPAGRLREKNYRRAHFFFLMHADQVSPAFLHFIATNLLIGVDEKFIFAGKHAYAGMFLDNAGVDQTISYSFFRYLSTKIR